MFEFRVTKYDPRFRAADGSYARDEWTSVSDIGRTYGGVLVTREEYERTESSYLAAARAFLEEAAVQVVSIRGLEDPNTRYPQFCDGAAVPVEEIDSLLSLMLREELWCRLEAKDAFVHIGYDYYMYVGVPIPCPFAERRAASLALFVEPFGSPYHAE